MNSVKKKPIKHQIQPSLLSPDFSNYDEKSGQEYHMYVRNARQYYYEEYKESDLIKYVWQWMEENGFSKNDIKAAQKAVGSLCYINIAINCKLLLDGMPSYYDEYAKYWGELCGTSGDLKPVNDVIKEFLNDAIQKGNYLISLEKEELQKRKDFEISNELKSDKTLELVRLATEPVEKWLSDFKSSNWDPNGFDFRSYFETQKFNSSHVKLFSSLYEKERNEFHDLLNLPSQIVIDKMDEDKSDYFRQLKEGYSNLTKPQIKLYYNALCKIIKECELYVQTKLVTNSNKKINPKSSDDLVKNLKYKSNDTMFDLTSIKPQLIIGSNELWIFNSKTRKLGCYVASNISTSGMKRPGYGLSVKGSTIIGFDENKSLQKMVRKPAEVLEKFKLAHKTKKNKVFDELSTIETKLNGRINTDIVLLYIL